MAFATSPDRVTPAITSAKVLLSSLTNTMDKTSPVAPADPSVEPAAPADPSVEPAAPADPSVESAAAR